MGPIVCPEKCAAGMTGGTSGCAYWAKSSEVSFTAKLSQGGYGTVGPETWHSPIVGGIFNLANFWRFFLILYIFFDDNSALIQFLRIQ